MLPDRKEFRKRVVFRLLSNPATLCPFMVGVTTLLGVWALNPAGAGVYVFLGISSIGVSFGIFLTKLFAGGGKIREKVIKEMEEEARQAREKTLDELKRKLVTDGDPRTEQYLMDLRKLASEFVSLKSSPQLSSFDSYSTFEIVSKVEELFSTNVKALERTLELWQTSKGLSSRKAKEALLRERENLIKGVGDSIEQLGNILAEFQASSITRVSGDKDSLLRELNERIQIAKRVQEEVRELGNSFGGKGIDVSEFGNSKEKERE